MSYIAADGDGQTLKFFLVEAERQGVGQRLGRMFMLAIASVDYGSFDMRSNKLWHAIFSMANNKRINPHRVEREGRIEEGFTLFDRAVSDIDINDVCTKPTGGNLK
jgi:hypothetical protein